MGTNRIAVRLQWEKWDTSRISVGTSGIAGKDLSGKKRECNEIIVGTSGIAGRILWEQVGLQ